MMEVRLSPFLETVSPHPPRLLRLADLGLQRLARLARLQNPRGSDVGLTRRPEQLPDYFTDEEAAALVPAAPVCQVRMAMRFMLRTGRQVFGCVSRCCVTADVKMSEIAEAELTHLAASITTSDSGRGA